MLATSHSWNEYEKVWIALRPRVKNMRVSDWAELECQLAQTYQWDSFQTKDPLENTETEIEDFGLKVKSLVNCHTDHVWDYPLSLANDDDQS